MRFVEAPRAGVLLEDPEREAVRPFGLGGVEQRRADAPAEGGRIDVQLRELRFAEDNETEHLAVVCDPRLAVGDAAVEEAEVLLVRVQPREKVERRERTLEDGDDRLDVRQGGPANHAPQTTGPSPDGPLDPSDLSRKYARPVRDRNEPVRLTKIYTRGGDEGKTSLGDGARVSKLDPRIVAYGIVDELNSHIGVVLAGELPESLGTPLARVQNELFDVGADLSVPIEVEDRLRVTQPMIDRLEHDCDELNAALPELKSFILPGGSESASRLHVARTVARRAEIASLEADVNPLARVYLNRLSDLLFIAARTANAAAGVDEPLWKPGG